MPARNLVGVRLAHTDTLKVRGFKGGAVHGPQCMPNTYFDARGKVCAPCPDTAEGRAHHPRMETRNHLRAWRKFHRMTLEQVGEAIGTTKAVIQQLESGRMGLSHKWLIKLAPVFKTTPGFLLDHDPNDIDTAYLEAAMAVPKDRRDQALHILETFKTGTDG